MSCRLEAVHFDGTCDAGSRYFVRTRGHCAAPAYLSRDRLSSSSLSRRGAVIILGGRHAKDRNHGAHGRPRAGDDRRDGAAGRHRCCRRVVGPRAHGSHDRRGTPSAAGRRSGLGGAAVPCRVRVRRSQRARNVRRLCRPPQGPGTATTKRRCAGSPRGYARRGREQSSGTQPTSTYLGFAPAEGLNAYADLLSSVREVEESQRMHSLALAYQQVQQAHFQRTMMFRQGQDPRGSC